MITLFRGQRNEKHETTTTTTFSFKFIVKTTDTPWNQIIFKYLFKKIYHILFLIASFRRTEVGLEHVSRDVTATWRIDKKKLTWYHIIKRELKQINFTKAKTVQVFKNRQFIQEVVGGRPHDDRSFNQGIPWRWRPFRKSSTKKIPKYETHQDDNTI